MHQSNQIIIIDYMNQLEKQYDSQIEIFRVENAYEILTNKKN